MDLNKKYGITFSTLILSIVAYVAYIIIINNLKTNFEYSVHIFILSWAGIIVYLYILITWRKLTHSWFSPYTIFVSFLFLFNYGQCFMWAFGIHNHNEIGQTIMYQFFGVASDYDIIRAQLLTLVSILMFHFGAVLSYISRMHKNIKSKKKEDRSSLNAIYISCFILSIIVIPVTLNNAFTDFQIAKQHGYIALYYSEFARTSATISGLLSIMFFPCLIGLLIGSKYNKKIMYFVYTVFAIYMIFYLLSGDRGEWVYKLIILIWLSHVCYKKINIKKILIYIIFGMVGVHVLDFIVTFRDVGLSNIDFIKALKSFSFENSPIISAVFEMGGSMQPTIVLQKYGWDVWPYGNTYILAMLGMVTNNLIYFFDIPFELLSSWFSQSYLGISWGAGFSIIAEALINGGLFFAPFILIIQGYLLSTLIYIPKGSDYKEMPLKYFFSASTLNFFIGITRNELHIILKYWFYGVIILIIFIIAVREFILNRKNKQ